jgi:hypothetical protein
MVGRSARRSPAATAVSIVFPNSSSDVATRLGDEKPAAGHQRLRDVAEEAGSVRELVDDGERQREVDLAGKAVDPEAGPGGETRLDPRVDSGALGSPAERIEHLLLDVDGDDSAGRADEPRQVEREEAHTRPRLKHRRAVQLKGRGDGPCSCPRMPEAPDCECRTSTRLTSSATTSPPPLCCGRADGVFGDDTRLRRRGAPRP